MQVFDIKKFLNLHLPSILAYMNLTTNQFGSYHLIVDKLQKGRSCPSHTTSKTYPQ
jgi:hypothetical protein